ncbi:MAG TPA: pitrilysin family protein [Ignavibacteria bacterium]|nr:pitrilysin family protein [Ignavibacteria bacterium]
MKMKSLDFHEFDLPNKLHCILYKDNSLPVINLSVGYNVGSKDEDLKKKGIAHLFEHLMFQGSGNVKKNEHFEFILKSGGTNNAFTMQDATLYYNTVPSNKLELALWLESDRMNSLDLTEENLANQKNVVIEEKKQRYENSPYGNLFNDIMKNTFPDSNYESSIIGEAEDINSVTVSEAVEFHNKYYTPENSILMISGDIDLSNAEENIKKYFSDIKKENNIVRKENIIKDLEDDVNEVLYDFIQLPLYSKSYIIPKAGSPSELSLEFFTEIIANNKSSRLFKKLVYEKKILQSVKANMIMLKDAGVLFFKALYNQKINHEDIRKEIDEEINEFVIKGISDEEFETVRNQIEFRFTSFYSKLINISIDSTLNHLIFKNAARINDQLSQYLSVSKEEIINSVNEFLINKKSVSLTYLPMNLKKIELAG